MGFFQNLPFFASSYSIASQIFLLHGIQKTYFPGSWGNERKPLAAGGKHLRDSGLPDPIREVSPAYQLSISALGQDKVLDVGKRDREASQADFGVSLGPEVQNVSIKPVSI